MRTFVQSLRTPIDLPLALFLISGLIGALISFDPAAAWFRFGLILIGGGLFMIAAKVPERIHLGRWRDFPILSLGLVLLPALLALYFLLTSDWSHLVGKEVWFKPIFQFASAVFPRLPSTPLNPDVVGGVLVAFIPLQGAALKWGRRNRMTSVSVILLGLSIFALLLSQLRGAWLALAAVGFLWGVWIATGFLTKRWKVVEQQKMRLLIWIGIIGLLGLIAVVAVVATPLGAFLITLRSDRWEVWRNSLNLVSDYPFTGLGLGGFGMAYSSYVLLLHVGYTIHAHNLYLDLWLQLGLLGLLSFAGMVLGAVRGGGTSSRWRTAAFASLAVLLLHGMIDDVFVGYGEKALPLLFVPLGLLVRKRSVRVENPGSSRVKAIAWGAAACLVALSLFLPSIRSAIFANIGALYQTRTELSVYRWPEWPIQDQVRRSFAADLAPAIRYYRAALAVDPMNITANRRLGQIELSLGQYEAAQQHLLLAYQAAPDQRATRQLLGEAYAIAGNIDRAATLWGTIDVSEGQLGIREWWYEKIGEPENSLWLKLAALKTRQ